MKIQTNRFTSSQSSRQFTLWLMAAAVLALIGTIFYAVQEATAQNATKPVTITAAQGDCGLKAKDLATVVSSFDVDETVSRLENEILARNLGVFAIIDHEDNAAGVGLELRPTTLILFGNPTVGTLLMQSEQSIGIDLPLKYLVWEDACGTVYIGYNTADFLQKRHKIKDQDQVFNNIANALSAIAEAAATP